MNISPLSRQNLIARYPKKGLVSFVSPMYGISLSPPISSVLIVSGIPFVSTAAFLYSSNCSSSVGSAFLLRKRNSVLKSPTPSAPALTALAASSAPPILAASITFFPSAVSVLLLINVFNSSMCSSYFFFFFSYIENVRCVGLIKTSP